MADLAGPDRGAAIARRLAGLFGTDRLIRARGATYRRLAGAWVAGGPAERRYRVRFEDGTSMTIRHSPERPYADLDRGAHLDAYQLAEPQLRPGMRVLVHRGLTGAPGAWCAGRVGPSGAVVSLESDAESVRFSRRRYRCPNVAYERGGIETLGGEVGESFDGGLVVVSQVPTPRELAELIRVIVSGGWLLLAMREPDRPGRGGRPSADAGEKVVKILREAWSADVRAPRDGPHAPGGGADIFRMDAGPACSAALLCLPAPGAPARTERRPAS